MTATGGCHCGAVRYSAEGQPEHSALCHCRDCAQCSGAPMVGWALFSADEVSITGERTEYASSEHGRRQFCGRCGTGLFYLSETVFPGQIDIQVSTFDDPDGFPPQAHIQVADDPAWMTTVADLPRFERFPSA